MLAMSRNYEIVCDPPPSVEAAEGYQFYRDQNGVVVVRCVLCRTGFVVREDSAADVGRIMRLHQLHVCKPR
jgi:hypothetical protein